MAKQRKLTKGKLHAIIVAAVCIAVMLSLIITNIYVPVKYLFSYMVVRNGRAGEGVMRVKFVDVGYGDCIIIELPDGKNMLIDAGNGTISNNAKIFKLLNKSGIDKLDYLVCSSVNSEHCGGLSEIVKYKTVEKIYMPYCENVYISEEYRSFSNAVKSSNALTEISRFGAGEDGGGYFFTFLSPTDYDNPEGEYAYLNSNPQSLTARNNSSAVIWLEYAGTAFLFTSDAADKTLTKIANSYSVADGYPVDFDGCTIVQVANHGSDSAACSRFYDCITPSLAVISVGDNGTGSPSVLVLSDVINHVGDKLYSTVECGTVTIEVTAAGYAVV